jgi:ribosome-associated toxin RatA of RatAB toxin-antitoxin module
MLHTESIKFCSLRMYFYSNEYTIIVMVMEAVRETGGASRRLGASVFVPVPPERLYETVLDVRSFPRWAPGVRRVEVLEGAGELGMVSEWEVSVLGLKRKVLSVLEEAEPPELLRWTYEGLIRGWGQCVIRDRGDGTLAEFQTELRASEPILERLMRTPLASGAASSGHLKHCLARLGRVVSEDGAGVRVGPLEVTG